MKVIIYTNNIGGVSICYPTNEISIEEVLAKDCPEGAIIINDSSLPQGDDVNYFDAWVLNNGVVTVDANKKLAIQAKQTIKESALSKLTALGLTAEEVKALLGTT